MRREQFIQIDTGRDAGKTYKITEMPASQAEDWAYRLLSAMARTGVDVPPGFFDLGMEGVAMLSIRAIAALQWNDAKPLLDEMMECVTFVPDPTKPFSRRLIEDDIEDLSTRLRIREEVVSLHTGFSISGALSRSTGKESSTPSPGTNGGDRGNGHVISMSPNG